MLSTIKNFFSYIAYVKVSLFWTIEEFFPFFKELNLKSCADANHSLLSFRWPVVPLYHFLVHSCIDMIYWFVFKRMDFWSYFILIPTLSQFFVVLKNFPQWDDCLTIIPLYSYSLLLFLKASISALSSRRGR